MEHAVEIVKKYLKEKDIDLLYNERDVFFWVDWREYDEDIVAYCEKRIKTGYLSPESIPADNKLGQEIFVVYKDKKVKILFDEEDVTRDPTFIALNEVLTPDFEVRFCMDSVGNDTLAFVVLPCSDWGKLENEFGEDKVAYYFLPIKPDIKMFAMSMKEASTILKERGISE